MKKSEVPQDPSSLSSKNITELCYATDESGNYSGVQSSGWEAKTLVLDKTLELLNERVEAAKRDVKQGKVSPLVYFMELNKMDISLLSAYTGFWKITIRRHFKPNVFKKIKMSKLKKYADVFGVTIEE